MPFYCYCFSRVRLCATPETAAHQAPLFLGFSRQEHWSGLPFPSPMHESEVTQSCPTPSDPMDGSLPGSSVYGVFQARVLEWGCHCLLQCMKVKSESEVAQSCPTPSDPMDCSLPGSSVHGVFQARVLEWGANAFSNAILDKHQIGDDGSPWVRDRTTKG